MLPVFAIAPFSVNIAVFASATAPAFVSVWLRPSSVPPSVLTSTAPVPAVSTRPPARTPAMPLPPSCTVEPVAASTRPLVLSIDVSSSSRPPFVASIRPRFVVAPAPVATSRVAPSASIVPAASFTTLSRPDPSSP